MHVTARRGAGGEGEGAWGILTAMRVGVGGWAKWMWRGGSRVPCEFTHGDRLAGKHPREAQST